MWLRLREFVKLIDKRVVVYFINTHQPSHLPIPFFASFLFRFVGDPQKAERDQKGWDLISFSLQLFISYIHSSVNLKKIDAKILLQISYIFYCIVGLEKPKKEIDHGNPWYQGRCLGKKWAKFFQLFWVLWYCSFCSSNGVCVVYKFWIIFLWVWYWFQVHLCRFQMIQGRCLHKENWGEERSKSNGSKTQPIARWPFASVATVCSRRLMSYLFFVMLKLLLLSSLAEVDFMSTQITGELSWILHLFLTKSWIQEKVSESSSFFYQKIGSWWRLVWISWCFLGWMCKYMNECWRICERLVVKI